MAKKKTSAELAKEQSEIAKVEGMLGDAFGSLGGLEQATHEEVEEQNSEVSGEEVEAIAEVEDVASNVDNVEEKQDLEEDAVKLSSGPPSKPPSGPPMSPPVESSEKVASSPSGPPSGPPSKPPSGPPSKPPSGPPSKSPSGPPSKPPSGPPSKPPSGPPSKPPSDSPSEILSDPSSEQPASSAEESEDLPAPETVDETNQEDAEGVEDPTINSDVTEEASDEVATDDDSPREAQSEDDETEHNEKDAADNADVDLGESVSIDEVPEATNNAEVEMEDIVHKEAEIARLSAEVERLRHSMSGAADIIEEMENPPMPPIVQEDVVIGAHIVADMARMARQLDRDELVRASMGTIAMLHPDRLDVLISTKHKALLPRMNENDICAGKLNNDPPRGAPTDWRVLEVLLASTSIVTGGPAAVIHSHGPYSTAVSCEKDLVLMQPIDAIGKEHIGKVIIVDPDDDNPREYLRQVAEALNQGGMRCVVIRGNGAYAVGADLDQAWANAAMLEHSMKIVMLARQANLII